MMVSTRQSSNISSSGENAISETGSIKSRHNVQNSPKASPSSSTTTVNTLPIPQPLAVSEHCHQSTSHVHILDLPQEILDKIFSFVGYKNVSQMRLVCRQLNLICSSTLNSTFQRLQNQMLARFQGIKAKMPRRESARRNHPLACESDIVETLHMRLTLLQMTFGKHIERKHCCFFAGEILDEVYRILHYIKVTPKLTRPYRVTDELFDLSTMAMEYFKEHIEPTLPEISYFSTDFLDFSTNGLTGSGTKKAWIMDSPPHTSSKVEYESPSQGEERPPEQTPQPQSNTVLRKRIRKIKLGMKKYNSQLALYKRELKSCKAKLGEQGKQFIEMVSRMDDNDKKNDETARKFSTLLQELNKCKTELQYWRSKSPLLSLCPSCGQNVGGGLMEGLMGGVVVWGVEGGGGGGGLDAPSDLMLEQQPSVAPPGVPPAPTFLDTPAPTPQLEPLTTTSSPVQSNKRRNLPDSTPYVLPKKSKKSRLKPMLKASQRTRRS